MLPPTLEIFLAALDALSHVAQMYLHTTKLSLLIIFQSWHGHYQGLCLDKEMIFQNLSLQGCSFATDQQQQKNYSLPKQWLDFFQFSETILNTPKAATV